MTRSTRRGSLLNQVKIRPLTGGIYTGDIVISNIDIEPRKMGNNDSKKFLYIKYAQLNARGRKVAESEFGFTKLDPNKKSKKGELTIFSDFREFLTQVMALMTCFMSEEEAEKLLLPALKPLDFSSADEAEKYRWKAKPTREFVEKACEIFKESVEEFTGLEGTRINLKVGTNISGDQAEIPRFGIFAEKFVEEEETKLKFSASELERIKAGNM